jgi:stage III sporulation protein SpoIIIAA
MADGHWVAQTADRVLAAMEETRSTWQMWHVRAEAQRHVRAADMPAEQANTLVDLLVDEVLEHRSVALAVPPDGIEEPGALRRVDGSSVYTIAGADLYTSQRILDAEQRLVAAAGRLDGASVEQTAVDLALLEMAANGTALDMGQASLVREMCTSGARLQLAIAPAGAGKTTAMRALTRAWTEDGGQVIGLAPSAAAADVLGEQTGIRTDTLAKLTWSLDHGDLLDWAAAVGPATLIIIDEAGMADTLSLDTAVQFAVDRGASVRLIGDDQQLAAIGAGGVLRDIKNIHGALQLTKLHRFTNPSEAQASLALREGDPGALGFYLYHGRVHVGDLAKITEDAFSAWVSDRAVGLDAIMLAPTRELVAELNRRARDHRRDGTPAGQEVRLGDGNQASVGDMINTRANDRRLRLSATDWVKNGDRWTITHVNRNGGLTIRHSRSQLKCQLPPDYVTTSTGLGYANTIHGAQGVSADTMHGLLTGQESRPQLYTMLTRGRHANQSSATAIPTPSSDPRPLPSAPRPRRCSRSSPATKRPSPPALCCASSTAQRPGSPRQFSATPTPSTSQPNSSSDPKPSQSSTKSTSTSPDSPPNPLGRPSEPTYSRWRPKPASIHSATYRKPPAVAISLPQATWAPSSTGASQSSRLPTQVRCLAP